MPKSAASGSVPLRAVFLDIGNTLGRVTDDRGTRRLAPFPTSAALLETLRGTLGLRVGVITNIPDDMDTDAVRAMLDAAGLLRLIDAETIVTSRDAGAAKPNPRIYAHAAGKVGAAVAECLYIGEDAAEVAGALRAGMAALAKPIPSF